MTAGRADRRAVLGVALIVLLTGCAHVVRSSVSNGGGQAEGTSLTPALSDDGRYVAFLSTAANLVDGDTNGVHDVFLRDHQLNTTTRVSVADDGAQADGPSSTASVSDNGRLVVFVSHATNLVPGDTNGVGDVFVRDVVAGTTRRITTTGGGGPVISGNGSYVAYVTSTEIVPGIFLQSVITTDLATNTPTTVVSSNIQPPIGPATFSSLSISDDGSYIAYRSSARHSLGIQFEGVSLWSRATGATTSIAGTSSPATMDGGVLSGNGRFVAVSSHLDLAPEPDVCAVDIGAPELPGACDFDVFVWDRTTGTFEAVSATSAGVDLPGEHHVAAISDDGAFVLFTTQRPELPGEPVQLQARDRVAGITQAITTPASAGTLESAAISGDGRLVAFGSGDALVPDDTNGTHDVFVRRTFLPTFTSVSPATVVRGGPPVELVLSGTRFEPGAVVGAIGSGLTISDTTFVSSTTIRVTFTAAGEAPTGPRTLFVINPAVFPDTVVGLATTACPCLTVS